MHCSIPYKYLFTLVVVTISIYVVTPTIVTAQPRQVHVHVSQLHTALESKNIVQLNTLLHDSLCYGHSNGWEESKNELKENLQSGKLSYSKIKSEPVTTTYTGKLCMVRYRAEYVAVLDDKEITLTLWVAQTWVYEKRKWKLIMRQSTKIT